MERTRKWVRRNKELSAGLAAAVLLLIAGTAVSTWQAVEARIAEKNEATHRRAAEAARKSSERDAATAKGRSKRAAGEKHKFDELDKGRLLFDYEKMVRQKLKFLSYAPIVFLSAKTGERANKLYPLIDQVAAARKRRIPTPELNRWLKEEVDLQRGTTPKARPVRIYYITQAKTAPPTFLIFTNQKQPLHFSYERFLENQLRAKFTFVGTPVRFIQRLRKRGEKSTGDQ